MANEAKWSDFASLDGSRMLAAANRLLPPWVAVLLVVVIGWQVAKIVWGLFPAPEAGDAIVVPSGQATASSSDSMAADVQAIAAAHIFGRADADDAPNRVELRRHASLQPCAKLQHERRRVGEIDVLVCIQIEHRAIRCNGRRWSRETCGERGPVLQIDIAVTITIARNERRRLGDAQIIHVPLAQRCRWVVGVLDEYLDCGNLGEQTIPVWDVNERGWRQACQET